MPKYWDEKKENKIRDFMSEEDSRMVDDLLTKINIRLGEMGDLYERWEKEQEAYSGSQEIEENAPNSRVNLVNANIEGQVAMLVDNAIAVNCKGQGPSDVGFADWGRIGLDWTLRRNSIKRKIGRHERRRLLFGTGLFKIAWNPEAINGFGLVDIRTTPLNTFVIDGKITDIDDFELAEYMGEFMPRSKKWAVAAYGDMAYAIKSGGSDQAVVFRKENSQDDEDLYWHFQIWLKTEGKLRLIEFSDDGVLLYDSFKEWDGRKFKEIKDPAPYYRKNQYPYFMTNLYYEEGQLWGFGDGKLLRPLQDMINDLYDQVRKQARPSLIFFDPASDVDLEGIGTSDTPVPCTDPNRNVRVVETGQVNPALWQTLSSIHLEVQRVIRFSELMLGQSTRSQTATEANIQAQQGGSGIDHKKGQLQETLIMMCEYILDIMIEKYDSGKAFRLDEDKDDFQWVDFRKLDNVPVMTPASQSYQQDFKQQWPDREAPQFEILKDETGEDMTKTVELDIDISIGQGMPKNKAFLWQMAERLGAIVIDGQQLIHYAEMRKFCREFLGLPLDENMDVPPAQPVMPGQPGMPGQPAEGAMPNMMQGADVQGQSANGNALLSALSGAVGGGV